MIDDMNLRKAQREKLRQERLAQQKKIKVGLAAAAVALLMVAILLSVLTRKDGGNPADTTSPSGETQEAATTEVTTVPDETTVIHIAAAGDLCVTDKTVGSGGVFYGGPAYDYTDVFMDVLPLLAEADLTLLNFEGNLCGAPYGTETASAPPALAEALATAGVDIVQVANSRSITNGLSGLKSTLSGLRAAGLEPLGAYSSNAEFRESGGYIIREINGVKVALVAFTKGMDSLGLPEGSEDCVNVLYEDYSSNYQDVDTEGITAILRAAAEELPDVTIAMVHWGSEYNDLISSSQTKILKLLNSEGVDVVLGTHPHLLQKMELNAEKGTFVAYSLGDFFSDGERAGSDYSVVLDLEITKNHTTGVTTVTGFSYTPIFNQVTDTSMRLLRLEDAIAAYEQGHIDRVSEEDYNDMVYALGRIEKRINPEQ